MPQTATTSAPSATLDALYSLIHADLKNVDALILSRVKSDVTLIETVARHIIASGGKRIRPALTLIAAQLCGASGERQVPLATSVEFIHTATLLHDDVVDESQLRRAAPTANVAFGNKASILVGDFLLSVAFQLMVEDGDLKVLKILSDASAIISQGEVLQLMCEGEPETSVENYLEVISSKTAVLFAAACELGAVAAGKMDAEAKLRDFGMNIGIAFQLIDDALDYVADEAKLGKTVGDDFREGKVTLPVISAYQAGSAEEKEFWKRVMSERDQRDGDLEQARTLMNRYGSITQTIDMAHDYCQRARDCLTSFPPSPAKSAMLDIVDFCAGRSY